MSGDPHSGSKVWETVIRRQPRSFRVVSVVPKLQDDSNADAPTKGRRGNNYDPDFLWVGGSMFSGNQQLTRLSGDAVQPTVAQRVVDFSPKTIFYPPQRADATQLFQ